MVKHSKNRTKKRTKKKSVKKTKDRTKKKSVKKTKDRTKKKSVKKTKDRTKKRTKKKSVKTSYKKERHLKKNLPIEFDNNGQYVPVYADMIYKGFLSEGHDKNNTVFVSGHLYASKSEFKKYYQPKIDEHIKKGFGFIVGGGEGVDQSALDYLLSKQGKFKITVCIAESEEKDFMKKYDKHSNDFHLISHFKSIKDPTDKTIIGKYKIRDIFMTNSSFTDIVCLQQYGGSSGSAATNLYRRKFGNRMADLFVKIIKGNSMDYSRSLARLTFEDIDENLISIMKRKGFDRSFKKEDGKFYFEFSSLGNSEKFGS